MSERLKSNLFRFLTGALFTLLLILAFRTILLSFSSRLQDFSYYLQGARFLLSGQNPYFTSPSQVYPPASLFIFIPLSQLPGLLANTIWTSVSLISLFLALHYFEKYILGQVTFFTELIIYLVSLQTFPVKFALGQGQINFLVFLGFALIFHFLQTKKDTLAGLTLAVITTLKFSPILIIPYLFLTKKTKSIYAFLFFIIIFNLSIDLIFPFPLNKSFIQRITNMSANFSGDYYNVSLTATIIRFFPQSAARFIDIGLAAFIWLISIFASIKTKDRLDSYLTFIIVILLTSPLTWQHYLFWSIPAFILLFSRTILLTKHIDGKSSGALATLVSFALINSNIKNPQAISPQNLLYSHATIGLILLWLLLIFKHCSEAR